MKWKPSPKIVFVRQKSMTKTNEQKQNKTTRNEHFARSLQNSNRVDRNGEAQRKIFKGLYLIEYTKCTRWPNHIRNINFWNVTNKDSITIKNGDGSAILSDRY